MGWKISSLRVKTSTAGASSFLVKQEICTRQRLLSFSQSEDFLAFLSEEVFFLTSVTKAYAYAWIFCCEFSLFHPRLQVSFHPNRMTLCTAPSLGLPGETCIGGGGITPVWAKAGFLHWIWSNSTWTLKVSERKKKSDKSSKPVVKKKRQKQHDFQRWSSEISLLFFFHFFVAYFLDNMYFKVLLFVFQKQLFRTQETLLGCLVSQTSGHPENEIVVVKIFTTK